jgi:molybdenum cofactor cytidylyltransferase
MNMLSERDRVFAIVPAAGHSRRMGAPKQLLDVGGRPMLRAVVEALATADVAGVVVVAHRMVAESVRLDDLPGVAIAFNDDPASEMIDSIRIGIRHWMNAEALSPQGSFLVCPADQPGITTADINRCIAASRTDPAGIVIASRAGKRGHPIVFGSQWSEFVMGRECDGGLNALPRRNADHVVTIECRSRGIARDVDTPADYRELDE